MLPAPRSPKAPKPPRFAFLSQRPQLLAVVVVSCVLGAFLLVAGISLNHRAPDAHPVHATNISQGLQPADAPQLRSATNAGHDLKVTAPGGPRHNASKETR